MEIYDFLAHELKLPAQATVSAMYRNARTGNSHYIANTTMQEIWIENDGFDGWHIVSSPRPFNNVVVPFNREEVTVTGNIETKKFEVLHHQTGITFYILIN